MKGFSWCFFKVEVDPRGVGLMELGFLCLSVSRLDYHMPNKVWALIETFPEVGAFQVFLLSHVPFPASNSAAELWLWPLFQRGQKGRILSSCLQTSNLANSKCFGGFFHPSCLKQNCEFLKLLLGGAEWRTGSVQFLMNHWKFQFGAKIKPGLLHPRGKLDRKASLWRKNSEGVSVLMGFNPTYGKLGLLGPDRRDGAPQRHQTYFGPRVTSSTAAGTALLDACSRAWRDGEGLSNGTWDSHCVFVPP